MITASPAPGAGVYVHIPFCSSRCEYCAFVTYTGREDLIDRYVAAVCAELAAARAEGHLARIDTVYFGGGTPSLIGAQALCRVLDAIDAPEGAEVSVECNPESTTPALLESLLAHGVNRISLGVQSFSDHVLAGLGRVHDRSSIDRALGALAAVGVTNYNIDLIYGAPAESDADWRASLETLLGLAHPPRHVSAYPLSVEPGTPLAKDPRRHPDDDVQARRYELACDLLEGAGYAWYELSNWAQPGFACRHNESCWQQGNYLGVGCAAHSHFDGLRWRNVTALERYLGRVESGASPRAQAIVLSAEERSLEALELSVRTVHGVPAAALGAGAEVVLAGLIETVKGQVTLTKRGRMLANEVILRLALS